LDEVLEYSRPRRFPLLNQTDAPLSRDVGKQGATGREQGKAFLKSDVSLTEDGDVQRRQRRPSTKKDFR
jgi:predicted DNA-binding WGR domain protein